MRPKIDDRAKRLDRFIEIALVTGTGVLLGSMALGSLLFWPVADFPSRLFVEFFLAVVSAALLGAACSGARLGIAFTVLIGGAGWYLVLPPEGSFQVYDQSAFYCLEVALSAGTAVSFFIGMRYPMRPH